MILLREKILDRFEEEKEQMKCKRTRNLKSLVNVVPGRCRHVHSYNIPKHRFAFDASSTTNWLTSHCMHMEALPRKVVQSTVLVATLHPGMILDTKSD